MKNYKNRVALVTGAAGGIGFALARALAAEGMDIVLADVDEDRLLAAKSELAGTGVTTMAIALDVANFSSWQSTVKKVEAEFGAIAILCNCAGLGGNGNLVDQDMDRWTHTIQVNLLGPAYGCRAVLPSMLASGNPCHIINIGSLSCLFSIPGISGYTASKHGLAGLTDSLRGELRNTNVGVSLVYPGAVKTDFGRNSEAQLQRHSGTREEVNPAIHAEGLDPDELAAFIIDGVNGGAYHIYPSPQGKPLVELVCQERLAAFDGPQDPVYREKSAQLAQTFRSVMESKV